MQKELTEYFHDTQTGPGLLLAEAPTGYGKTYQTVQAIYAYLKQGGRSRVVFVTTLLKNLPVEELRRAYEQDGRGDDFAREVLVLRACADTVIDALEQQEVPDEFKTDAFRALESACRKYRYYRAQKGDAAAELSKELHDSIREKLEPAFRRELEAYLRRAFPGGAAQKRAAIRSQKRYRWAAAFYPEIFWSDYPVLLCSVNKLMACMVPVVEPGFDCLSDRLLQGAIVCIDEFDASRAAVLDCLVESSLKLRADYLQLFIQIYKGIRMHQASRDLTALRDQYEQGRALTWQLLLDQAEQIYQEGALYFSMKTVDGVHGRGRNFLFHDTSYLTVLDGGKTHIRAERNEAQRQVQIHFDTPELYHAHRDEPRLVLQTLLRRIHVFLRRFQWYVYGWADRYAQHVNAGRKQEEGRYTTAAAAESIFREYDLSSEQIQLMTVCLEKSGESTRSLVAPDLSFYETGFRLFEFIDDDRHHTQTRLQYLQMQNTPEKVLLYLCRRAKVVGLSATACLPTVLGNYDLRYLREELGAHCRTLTGETQEKIRREMETLWSAYRSGAVQVRLEVVDERDLPPRERLEAVFGPGAAARRYEQKFAAMGVTEYGKKRYCNLFAAMKAFWQHGEIQAFLCLNQTLPAPGKSELDEDLLQTALEDLRRIVAPGARGSLAVLRSGARFEDDKECLRQSLKAGERRMIFSSYQTLGAGQNLQYPVQSREGLVTLNDRNPDDGRLMNKDVDALYLGDITHVSVNLQDAGSWQGSELMRYCFQMECLYQNDEISCRSLQGLLKAGIGRFSGKSEKNVQVSAQVRQCPSFSGKVTRDVVQAVGRMGRTFLKCPNVYLFTTSQVLQNLDGEYLEGRLLSPEMQAVDRARRAMQAAGRTVDRVHLEAERIATRGNGYLMQLLSAPWTAESMALWKQMRRTVLCHPRADGSLRENDPVIRTYYLPMAPGPNQYFFAQKGDFSEVRLAPANARAAFSASLPEGFLPGEVSAEEARLPVLLRYPGMREHFEANDWATEFGSAPYILSPVLFQNVYKGALGEAAGAFILQRELGLALQEIDDPACFERFDFTAPGGLWFDFKHWKSTARQDADAMRRKTLDKLEEVGGKRALLINLIAEPEWAPACTADGRLIEVPGLLLPDGAVNRRALESLGRWIG